MFEHDKERGNNEMEQLSGSSFEESNERKER